MTKIKNLESKLKIVDLHWTLIVIVFFQNSLLLRIFEKLLNEKGYFVFIWSILHQLLSCIYNELSKLFPLFHAAVQDFNEDSFIICQSELHMRMAPLNDGSRQKQAPIHVIFIAKL